MKKDCTERPSHEDAHFRRIGFLVYPDCQSLDLSGPFEAFHWADLLLGVLGREKAPTYQSIIIAKASGPVRTMSGLEIVATDSYREIIGGLDTLIVMGGTGCEDASQDQSLVAWVRSIAPKTRRIVSICSGAFVLAAAGLLHRRRVTTHWIYADRLAKAYPSVEVDASLLFVRDGNIYTSGGITAGIDLALALVEEDLGSEAMLGVARHLLVFPRRPGGQSQFRGHSSIIESPIRPHISELQAWMLAHPEADLSVPALANRAGMSERNFSGSSEAKPDRPLPSSLSGRGLTQRVTSSSKTVRPSRRLPPNAASATLSECDARFSVSLALARPIIGRASDRP